MNEDIKFEDVQAALMRCLAIQPPVDYVLGRDASRLADLFARMSYQKVRIVSPQEMPADVLALYERWRGPVPGQPDNDA
jgi:hypothetical protein